MNNILVVSGDRPFLEHLKPAFSKLKDQYRLVTADDGPVGLEILSSQSIDFVAASLNLPQMDGIQFLTLLRQIKPALPTVVITSNEATYMGGDFMKLSILKVLIEPVTADRLIDCIQEVLFLKTQQGRLQGISIVNFLQLINMEKQTYLLEVKNPTGDKGLFYFHEGVLFDALYGELTAESAALEMITWENVEINFRPPPTKKVKRHIDKTLMSLLMDGVLLKDTKAISVAEKPEMKTASRSSTTETDDAVAGEDDEDYEIEDLEQSPAEPEQLPAAEPEQLPAGPSEGEDRSRTVDKYLKELYDLRGVKAAVLINAQGCVVGSLGSWPGSDLSDFGAAVALVSRGAEKMIRELRLAGLQTMTLESNGAVIMCLPAGDSLLAVLAPDSKTLGIIRQKALKISLEILRLYT